MTFPYHGRALPRNGKGAPDFAGLPLFDFFTAHTFNRPEPDGLTPGGRIIYRRTRRPVSTCNTLARLAGIDCGEMDHA